MIYFSGDRTSSIEGTATLASKNGDAILDVEFDIIGVPVHAPYNVISTDYTSYAVVYSCSEILGITYSSTSWILTREQNPPESLIKKGYSILEGQKIKTDSLKKTNQENCN
ncbi:unnamed protein product [Psylliodes chrysocephalus]|uniref:Lipocalin/cytosolic fatty-acid binding domain-containing protein n=1 Tax=Psylliodes chrysocephalus TaxID=3402493 RepID=A0A9P0D3X6_9CUCU|nr:unnamed protein product [Psylliodes chrysocephala]